MMESVTPMQLSHMFEASQLQMCHITLVGSHGAPAISGRNDTVPTQIVKRWCNWGIRSSHKPVSSVPINQ